ncbi:hypothetical protein MAR_025675 [Mya arenaria]|uniref:Reverse transcriptase RNase H-like domain-containing protein n=1 Tax=Mya arenaria TaxID=6604 RepID=A0ABY7ENC5_MYAAR|nr:hypothetical protein MAR_025675 [Mya arenaria]
MNFEKSNLVPTQRIAYIGYTICTADSKIIVKVQLIRVARLKRSIRRVLSQGLAAARQLAKVLGQCVSVAWAVTPGKLFLRNSARKSWSDSLIITPEVAEELQWWLNSVDYWNSREICSETIQAQVVTDASGLGWGATYGSHVASGDWNRRVSYLSSNEREMLAILMAIKAFAKLLRGLVVQVLTDNISAMTYINQMGGPSQKLSRLALAIWAEAFDHGITLRCAHIAGVQNGQADYWSRTPDKHNWMLHPAVFGYIDKLYGRHTIDRLQIVRTLSYRGSTVGTGIRCQKQWTPYRRATGGAKTTL